MSTCPFCGERINSSADKCTKCGANLQSQVGNIDGKCPKCGGTLTGTESTCPYCLSPLRTKHSVTGETSSFQKVVFTPPSQQEADVEVTMDYRKTIFTAALHARHTVYFCPKCESNLGGTYPDPMTYGISVVCNKCNTSVDLRQANKEKRPLFPILTELTICNNTKENANFRVLLYVEPRLTERWKRTYGSVPPKGKVTVTFDANPKFYREKFIKVPDDARLHLDIFLNEKPAWQDTQEIEVLAYNQMIWEDEYDEYYSLLASFVMPEDPAVEEVIGKARTYLKKLTGSTDFCGYYVDNIKDVSNQVKAIYMCLQNDYHLSYLLPPPRYGVNARQTILLPSEALKNGQGCCIDFAILFASCIERIKINPLIFLVPGHAFPGFFLYDRAALADMWFQTGGISRNLHELLQVLGNSFVAFESTRITEFSFEKACSLQESLLNQTGPDSEFVVGINMKFLRLLDLRPMPIKTPVQDPQSEENTHIDS